MSDNNFPEKMQDLLAAIPEKANELAGEVKNTLNAEKVVEEKPELEVNIEAVEEVKDVASEVAEEEKVEVGAETGTELKETLEVEVSETPQENVATEGAEVETEVSDQVGEVAAEVTEEDNSEMKEEMSEVKAVNEVKEVAAEGVESEAIEVESKEVKEPEVSEDAKEDVATEGVVVKGNVESQPEANEEAEEENVVAEAETKTEDEVKEEIEEEVKEVATEVVEETTEVESKLETEPEESEKAEGEVAAEGVESKASEEEKVAELEESVDVKKLADKNLAELSEMFVKLKARPDSMLRHKEADAISSAFNELLLKLKKENPEISEDNRNNPFESIEQNFKAIYADYKRARAEYNKQQDEIRAENLKIKEGIIEELRVLVEGQEDMSSQFPAFREIQNRWREVGPVPTQSFREINDKYQFLVEKFYDMVKISRDLRDLDFKKNLEIKTTLCEAAEKLAESENVVAAFQELQKLHEQWKEYGPVARNKREEIWNRFKAATAVVNKRYQAHFDGLRGQQKENLEKKRGLCEEVEAISQKEIKTSGEWNSLSKEIEEIQARWRKIGFATKKENQRIYDRFRAACDAFYARKREYYSGIKDEMNENLEKKMALIEQAEAIKNSTDWKKTTDQYISLQKQWKEIGPVPRKKSDLLWKRFRAACDEFFANRDANVTPANDFYGNLKAKRKLIEDIKAYVDPQDDAQKLGDMREFQERWREIGHVPYKEKDAVIAEFNEAMQEKFSGFNSQTSEGRQSYSSSQRSNENKLIAKYNLLQQNIITYENNLGFFSSASEDNPLIKNMQAKIEEAKAELKKLEEQIRNAAEEKE